MIAGHFGFAAAVKARERQVPLWALMLACVWLDILFVPLFVMKIETITPAPGTSGGYGSGIIHADYTHSIVGMLALSAIFGAVAAIWWGRRTGTILGAVVASHWVLDLVVHRADMPILPANVGDLPRLGFGLWRAPVAAMIVELILVVIGGLVYWRAARSVSQSRQADAAGLIVLVSGIAVLALDFTGIFG